MKIIFFATHLKVSGGMRIILGYASELSKRGNSVTICVLDKNPLRRFVANVFQMGNPKWMKGVDRGVRIYRVLDYLPQYIPDADVLIATNVRNALMLDKFPESKGRQFYLLQHDEGLYHYKREDADRAYKMKAKKIVVATWLKEMLEQKFATTAALLLNPIDKTLFHPLPRTLHLNQIRILLLAHTYDWKGTEEGVKIIHHLKKKYPNIRLIMFGVRMKDEAKYHADEFYYDLPQEKLSWLYSNVDIFVCPSWDEGFGLPSVEAMACGVALVTYDNGGSRDFAFHEKTALVARHRDQEDLECQIERLIVDVVLRKQIALRGQEYVFSMSDWNTQAERFEEILSGK